MNIAIYIYIRSNTQFNIENVITFTVYYMINEHRSRFLTRRRFLPRRLKSSICCSAMGQTSNIHDAGYAGILVGALCKHIKFFFTKRLFMHVPLKFWASGFRIEDTPSDRFTGRVCKKKVKQQHFGQRKHKLKPSL